MRTSRITIAAAAALLSVLPATEARADLREFRVYLENDSWFNPPGYRTDQYYTQGMKFEQFHGPRDGDMEFLPGITHADWCSLLCGKGEKRAGFESGHAVGQNMYTPEDISVAAPQPNDRPWAGYLYASRIARVVYDDATLGAERQDRIEVSLGVVGPASLAGETQTAFHDIIGSDLPRGWHNQLRNEPVLQLGYDTAVRWPINQDNADIIPRLRANFGNAVTSLEGEATLRLGWKLRGFGTGTIAPTPPPPVFAMIQAANRRAGAPWRPRAHIFLRGAIKAVAHNVTLDGNSFADNDILIRRKPIVPEVAGGLELKLNGNWGMSYQLIRRGSEFRRLNGPDAKPQLFGAFTVFKSTRD